ncbi:MAG: TonB-dependent receptor plug domain-containing protein [Flavobacteriales bacterium]|nr:TonB-dependent receptor plug domain-containing protein [Flavobacteriales bacterium]
MDVPAGRRVMVVMAIGFERLETTVHAVGGGTTDLGDVRLVPTSGELEEVVVTGTLKEVSRSESPVPVEVLSSAFFRKNPSPALFDAVGMVNGVRPQINCSVCNTGDIHINGMEGPYTMVLIDGMPMRERPSTVYGLSGIPNSLVERVEVVKGPGSALYGSEAMGGIINVITKDPVLAPRFSADVFGTTWNEWNADLGMRLGKGRARDLLGVNLFRYNDPRDINNDGFTDVTLQERVSVFNKFDLQRPQHRLASLAARYVTEDRWGGQLQWTDADKGSDRVYGESINTVRYELIGQYQLPLRERASRSSLSTATSRTRGTAWHRSTLSRRCSSRNALGPRSGPSA